MDGSTAAQSFEPINRGFARAFRPARLSIGLVAPLEAYDVGALPHMDNHLGLAQHAEQLGVAALWLRDVPFNVPSFGNPGQIFDPFVYLGLLAAGTERIAFGTSSIIVPLRHPAHVAKAAATADVRAGGSQQTPEWLTTHGDGWMTYPRDTVAQKRVVEAYRARLKVNGQPDKPVMQSLYIDLLPERSAPPRPIHLGFQSGVDALLRYLRSIEAFGINDVALNLRFNQAPIPETLERLAEGVLPEFG